MSIQQQVQVSQFYLLQQSIYGMAIFIFILWLYNRNSNFELRMIKSRSYSSSINDQKIILAIELKNFIFETSDTKMNGYEQLDIQQKENKNIFRHILWNKVKKMFGYGAYYKLMFQKNKIRMFFKQLRQIQNFQVYLYTSLTKQFTEHIIRKLQIQQFFPVEFRRYSEQQQSKVNQKKHPTWIDHNTRRVVIMTANKEDFDQEDKKYFLVLNRLKKDRLLKISLKLIRQIIDNVKSIDQLHNEMDEIKAQIQTDNQMDGQYIN